MRTKVGRPRVVAAWRRRAFDPPMNETLHRQEYARKVPAHHVNGPALSADYDLACHVRMDRADVVVGPGLVVGATETLAGQQQIGALDAVLVGESVRRAVVVGP